MADQHILEPVLPVGATRQRRQFDPLVGKDCIAIQRKLIGVLEIPAALIKVLIERQDRGVAVPDLSSCCQAKRQPSPSLTPSPMTIERTKSSCRPATGLSKMPTA